VNTNGFKGNKKIMKNCRLLVLLLLAGAACGQTADIHGLKIKQSGFDGTTMTISLTFINDRAADVTAYHYCFKAIAADPKQTSEHCEVVDALTHVLEDAADRRARPGLPVITFSAPDENVVHPGQERRIEERIPWSGTFIGGSMSIDAVVWSDDTFEGAAESIIAERTVELQERQFVSRTISDTLSGSRKPMVASAIEILQQELQESRASRNACSPCRGKIEYVLMEAILHLQQPERYKGKTKEFVPDNQREFLKQFQVRYDSFSEEQAKHVNLRKADAQ
jgi:hypothetical protein